MSLSRAFSDSRALTKARCRTSGTTKSIGENPTYAFSAQAAVIGTIRIHSQIRQSRTRASGYIFMNYGWSQKLGTAEGTHTRPRVKDNKVMKRSDSTLLEVRNKLPWPADKPFRILSIDGGGIKGILPAALLAQIEDELPPNQRIGTRFDMIAGTSTGGIIALGIALGLPARKILDLYMTKGAKIFPSAPWPFKRLGRYAGFFKQLAFRRYNPQVLDHELAKIIGGRKFGEATCRLVIPAFDQNTEPCIFKTPHHPDYRLDWVEDALTVARATSAAPTFLEGLEHAGRRFWDGGVFANNPVMMAVTDALACYNIERRQIKLLSLGCASETPKLTKKHLRAGLWGWRSAHAIASSLQSHDALGQAGLLIGRDNLLRIDEVLVETIDMDDFHGASSVLPSIADRLFAQYRTELNGFIAQETDIFKAFYGPRS